MGQRRKRAEGRQTRGQRGSDAEQKAKELQRGESQTSDGWGDGGRSSMQQRAKVRKGGTDEKRERVLSEIRAEG